MPPSAPPTPATTTSRASACPAGRTASRFAGDQISAASFLGITGAVALTGFDGVYLAVGIPTAYLLVLLVIAEPPCNLGRYTLADAVAARFDGSPCAARSPSPRS